MNNDQYKVLTERLDQIQKVCCSCSGQYKPTGNNQKYCSSCIKIKEQESYKAWRKTPIGVSSHRRAALKYAKTAKGKENRKRYVETHRKAINKQSLNYINQLRDLVFKKYGTVCIQCGYNNRMALQIDHVNGGGNIDRRSLSLRGFLKKVLEDKEGRYQILCANCNQIKRFINEEHN